MRNEGFLSLGWRRKLALAFIVALGLGTIVGSGGGGGDPPPPPSEDTVFDPDPATAVLINGSMSAPNLLRVRFRTGATDDDMAEVVTSVGGQVVGTVPLTMLVQAKFEGLWSESRANQLIEQLQAIPIVRGAYLETLVVMNAATCPTDSLCPNDPWWTKADPPPRASWDTDFLTGQNWPIKAMRADKAWSLVYGSGREIYPVVTGLIDNGFGEHPDLQNVRVLKARAGTEMDMHGMHVAGIMGAVGNNESGIAGVAWQNHKILAYNLPSWPQWRNFSWITPIEAGLHALLDKPGNEVRVINKSSGNCFYIGTAKVDCAPLPTVGAGGIDIRKDMRKAALEAFEAVLLADKLTKVLIVHSAGNSGNEVDASYNGFAASALWNSTEPNDLAELREKHKYLNEIRSQLLVVGATYPVSGTDVGISSESSTGDVVEIWAPGGTKCPDATAHGCQILSTGINKLFPASGTSMAAPHISGLAALLWQVNPEFSAAEVKNLILLRGKDGLSPRGEAVKYLDKDRGIVADAEAAAADAIATLVNRPPVAGFSFKQTGASFAFDATTSIDPDGDPIVEHNWVLKDLSGLNIDEQRGSNSPTWSVAVPKAGQYRVSLSVSDGFGLVSAQVEQAFTVDAAALIPPPDVLAVSPGTMTANGTPQLLAISGRSFRFKNVVQFRSGVGSAAGVWATSNGAIRSLSSSGITVPLNPGDVADAISVRVCRSSSLTSDSDCSAGTQAVTVTAPPSGPDLVIQNITFSPGSVAPGGRLQMNFVVANVGPGPAAASVGAIRFNQSSTSSAGTDAATFNLVSIPSGGNVNVAVPVLAPSSPGVHRVWVVADNNGASGENTASAANNEVLAAATLVVIDGSVTGPVVTSISVEPPSLSVDAHAIFSVNGRNLQAGYRLSFPGCVASELASSASTTLRQFACTVTQSGSDLAGNVTTASGTLLYSFALPVSSLALPAGSRISAGPYHTCAVTNAAGVKCWGNNAWGQLGDGSKTNRLIPVDVLGLTTGVIAVAAGGHHTCALTTAGGVKCWGYNYYGGLGDDTSIDRLTPVDVVGLSGGAIAIAAGDKHTCAVTVSGGVKCWGYNSTGQLGDGGPLAWRLRPVDVSGLSSGAIAVAAGPSHTCAITSSRGVKCWGWNANGRLGDGTVITRQVPVDVVGLGSDANAVSAGPRHTCALTTAGGLKCWGANVVGQLGDGTVTNRLTPVDVFGLSSGVIAVAGGEQTTCALMAAGGAKCWGGNLFGEIGDDTRTLRRTPVDVLGLGGGAKEVAAGSFHTCVLTTAGGVKCWGYNTYGQVGDGTRSDRHTPVDVSGF